MGWEFRALLLVGAVLSLIYFFYQIRKNRMQIDYAIFWSLLSVGLLILGIFPNIVIWAAAVLEVESPANLLFAGIIFVLIFKLFTTTVKLSRMNRQITEMAQKMAVDSMEDPAAPHAMPPEQAGGAALGEQDGEA